MVIFDRLIEIFSPIETYGLRSLRAVRVVRPLKSIKSIPGKIKTLMK